MAHDTHFLTRLERLPGEQVEAALGLYRDPELVAHLLDKLELPESVERVAVSLADPVAGPFVVVTRQGRFVTCLGEGMGVGDTLVVTKERFDGTACRLERLRELAAEARQHPRREVVRLFGRMLDAGDAVTREEFVAVAAWGPLVAGEFYRRCVRAMQHIDDAYLRLCRRRGPLQPADEPAARVFWSSSWALAHMMMLLGNDNGELLRRAITSQHAEDEAHLLFIRPARLNTLAMSARCAWLASRVGKSMVAAKRPYRTTTSDLELFSTSLVLAGVGLAHRRLRAEVGKALTPAAAPPDDVGERLLWCFRRIVAKLYDGVAANMEALRTTASPLLEAFVGMFHKRLDPGPERDAIVAAPLEDAAVPMALRACWPVWTGGADKFDALQELFMLLPRLVTSGAAGFYMPARFEKLFDSSFTLDRAASLLEARHLSDRAVSPRRTYRAEAVPPPNAACSCGSGKKYKRCCGAV